METQYTATRHKSDIFCVLCAPFAFLAVKNFYRKGRKDLRKGRKEKCQVIAGLWYTQVPALKGQDTTQQFSLAPFAFLAVKIFYRKGRKDLRKGRKEKCQVIAG